ncbi:Gfo/Idh/MocA family protein [Paenibacillus rigui]|uniref:Dehydrogenase n=1 Tax=Paenibacillus rigui TaxID=554312 RepID=A0A229UXT8_9BACL|nr:Gfo/Idh/MocA family oxidoreductase [Paenibacillus rigui]OXM88306.1 dehydrogenase [Paenibacillus rigui]
MKKRVGLIGLGDIAQKVYLPLLSADPQVELAAVSSRTASTVERIADQYRIQGRYPSLEAMLESKLDAVFIHSPTETHYDLVMTCLRQGTAVYVDKPLSYNYSEAVRMAEFALEQGLLLGVGFNRRFAPMYIQAKAWLEEAGGFEQCTVLKHRTKLQQHSAKHTLYDDLIHMLDLLLWLGGEHYEQLQYHQSTNEEDQLLLGTGSLVFGQPAEEGAFGVRFGQFSMARRTGSDLEKLELYGNYRTAEVVNMESAVWSEQGAEPRAGAFGSWDTILHRRGFAGAVQHFLQCLDDQDRCLLRADRVLPSHELVERLASKAGRRQE